jgi:hypothetical protein
MFIDTTVKSRGHITVKATTLGSYGEAVHRQFGPAYRSTAAAVRQADRLFRKGMRDIELHNINTHHRYAYNGG